MRRTTRMFCLATAVTAWAFSGLADPPVGSKPGRGPHPSGSPPRPSGERAPHPALPAPPGSVGESEGLRRGRPHSEALKARMAELDSTRRARKLERLEAFRSRFSPTVLADPRVKNELRAHARRMAMLHRAELVGRTELEEPKRSQVLARVKMLIEREQARHARRMDKARAAFPAGSASGRRPVPPPPKGSAP